MYTTIFVLIIVNEFILSIIIFNVIVLLCKGVYLRVKFFMDLHDHNFELLHVDDNASLTELEIFLRQKIFTDTY